MELGHLLGTHVTYVKHTVKISNVKNIYCVDKRKDGNTVQVLSLSYMYMSTRSLACSDGMNFFT